MKTVYISGRISGLQEVVYKKHFADAEKLLKEMGYTVVNPAKKGVIPGYKWEDYMREDIKLLLDCDYIYFLPAWSESRGAIFEHDLAVKLNIPTLKILGKRA